MYFNKKCHLSPFKLIRYSLHEHTHDCKVKVQLGLSCWQGLGHSHSAFDLTLLRPLCCFCESWSSLACKRQRPSQLCQVKHDWKSLKQWLAQVKRNRSPIRICSRWFFIVLSLISQCRWCQSRQPSVHFRQKWNGRWKLHSRALWGKDSSGGTLWDSVETVASDWEFRMRRGSYDGSTASIQPVSRSDGEECQCHACI